MKQGFVGVHPGIPHCFVDRTDSVSPVHSELLFLKILQSLSESEKSCQELTDGILQVP